MSTPESHGPSEAFPEAEFAAFLVDLERPKSPMQELAALQERHMEKLIANGTLDLIEGWVLAAGSRLGSNAHGYGHNLYGWVESREYKAHIAYRRYNDPNGKKPTVPAAHELLSPCVELSDIDEQGDVLAVCVPLGKPMNGNVIANTDFFKQSQFDDAQQMVDEIKKAQIDGKLSGLKHDLTAIIPKP